MKRRLKKEIEKFRNNPVCGAEIEEEIDEEKSDSQLIVNLPGPEGRKYENIVYKISFDYPKDYPFKAPKIKFITPINHPLFQKYSQIHVFSLFGEDWSPNFWITDIIERIYFFMSPVETRIDTYKTKNNRYTFEKRSINSIIKGSLGHSFNDGQELAFLGSNVPVLDGFYTAHTNHYPIKIKPDDIWLLIIQGFINHINLNHEELRNLFVNFEGKKELNIEYLLSDIKEINKNILEDFSKKLVAQISDFIGKEIIELLTPNFTTTTYDSEIICKISIMGAFKHYFDYNMIMLGCGVPYVVLDGTADDYRKIIDKAKKLKKYKLGWYIDRIIPHLEKMVEAKDGKMDKEYFKNMIQKSELVEEKWGISGGKLGEYQVDVLSGWFLNFFSHIESDNGKQIYEFIEDSIKIKDFKKLTNQIVKVPFKVMDLVHNKTYDMNFKVGFAGCDINDKNEVFPVQGWWAYEGKD